MYIYLCDNTPSGIFTAVYDAWSSRLGHKNIRIEIEEEMDSLELFCEYIRVATEDEKAEKVARSILKKLGYETYKSVYQTALSGKPGRADEIYRFLLLGFSVGSRVLEQVSHPYVHPVLVKSRSVGREYQHYQGFLRFSELENGILFSEIRPFNDLLELLAEHFSDRFSGENWIIYEAGRKKAAFHRSGLPFVIRRDLEKEELLSKLGAIGFSEKEEYLQLLWKTFIASVSIEERKNEKLQKQLLPLRYREFMREYNPE